MNTNSKQLKENIRTTYLAKRNMLSKDTIRISSQAIIKKILHSDRYLHAKKIFCYYPNQNECNLLELAEHALNADKIVAFPKSSSKRHMDFFQVNALDNFTLGRFGIMEPSTSCLVHPDEDTLILVPGIAFDDKNYRIGHGGGYYDTYFHRFSHSPYKKIGVYYQWQQTPSIPVESHDIPLDAIIVD
ncbi:5-formyltetrahydrofolate cyclo-ligase [Vallitaleaceae bacterium 9-2]